MNGMQRILAVDDNEDILEIMKLILEGYDYEVNTLTDGSLLFDQIKKYRPDLILLDIMLGNMDGRELCKSLKSNNDTHDIPVIMISASHTLSERFKPCDAPNDFLAKPFDISELLSKVQTHLSAA
jgi:DNA-binding response OmpR family regulator